MPGLQQMKPPSPRVAAMPTWAHKNSRQHFGPSGFRALHGTKCPQLKAFFLILFSLFPLEWHSEQKGCIMTFYLSVIHLSVSLRQFPPTVPYAEQMN